MVIFGASTFMVLRFLFIFSLIISFSLHARRGNSNFKRAQIQFKKHQYSKSIRSLKKAYNFKRPNKIPASALFLIGSNYQKLKKHSRSVFYFNRLIKTTYVKKNIKVLRALKKDELDDVKIPKMLSSTYFYMAQSYYALFNKKKALSYAKKAERYFRICDESDFNDKCSNFLESIEKRIEYTKKQKKKYEFFIFAGRFIFQDRIKIEEDSSGVKSTIVGNNTTLCYGTGLRYGSAFRGYQFSGCILTGTATVKGVAQNQAGAGNDYSQDGVPIGGFLIDGMYYIKLDNESTRLAVGAPFIYRSALYEEPEGYTISNKKGFNFGINFSASMQLPYNFEFETKFGHMGDSNLLSLNLIYNF